MACLDDQLNHYFNQNSNTERSDIEKQIWQSFGVEGTVMITDMSAFSLVTQRYGIVYYLSMIHKMREISQQIIERNQGHLVKFVADNVFARFDSVEDAINSAIEINQTLKEINQATPDMWDIKISTGIDYGKYLYTDEGDIYGDNVNCASKLGEDIASSGEILVTEKAVSTITNKEQYQLEQVNFSVSGISLTAYQVAY